MLCLSALGLTQTTRWNAQDLRTLKSLSLNRLEPLAPDPTNRVSDDIAAARLGHMLFFDVRLSGNGEVSCATCHDPKKNFTDGQSLAEGMGTAGRNTPSIVGSGHSKWLFWDGRADSLWAQALGPLEAAAEHGTNRMFVLRLVAQHYREDYEAIFGPLPALVSQPRYPQVESAFSSDEAQSAWKSLPDAAQRAVNRVFANVGKAIAAYERRVNPGLTRFDAYIGSLASSDTKNNAALTPSETNGLELFIGKAGCVSCHNGPLLTDGLFHNTDVPPNRDLETADIGRAGGLLDLLNSDFNCKSWLSDAPNRCAKLEQAKSELGGQGGEATTGVNAFKTPSLRGVAQTAPYMHAGQFSNLRRVLEHYSNAPNAEQNDSELRPANLTTGEIADLEAFLKTLSAAPIAPTQFLKDPFRP
ncbi:MAG: cytochrome-c peroxidase [Pleurocapsa sp. SU_196_0]|nr:cytochrome-c peroxidase [Pleurocapsa sp. SU_196_0]